MPNVREIRRRIKSVQNTAKITKAMSMIAASKMRRAQEMALNARPYSERIFELLKNVSEDYNNDDALYHPLLERRPEKNYTLIPTKCLCDNNDDILLSKSDRPVLHLGHGVKIAKGEKYLRKIKKIF